ncbi:MAG: glucosaminidase domain-containing protein [Ferruginibacter sp.]
MKKIAFAIIGFTATVVAHAQTLTVQQYVDKYKDLAIAEMKRSGIPASITLAQGILETENGNSDLVKRSNNHFGIKCKSTWTGESVTHTDDAPNECFRKYPSALDSYKDHSDYLKNTPRYASLFQLNASDYKGWAYGLRRAGYATNPRYPEILIRNIEQYNLQQYNSVSTDDATAFDAGKFIDEKKEEKIVAMATASAEQIKKTESNNPPKKVRTLFNSLKAVYAPKQTSLLAIATNYDIDLAKLLEYNDLKTDGLIKTSQWIYLEKKPKQGNRDFYIAIQNETLYAVSQNNAVQLQYLMNYNQMQENEMIKIGKKIKLRPNLATAEKPDVEDANVKIHEVQLKEGLYSIAKKYNVTVEEIKEWNNLETGDLKVGQQLIISK